METYDDNEFSQWAHLEQDFVCPGLSTPASTVSALSTPCPSTPDSVFSSFSTPSSLALSIATDRDNFYSFQASDNAWFSGHHADSFSEANVTHDTSYHRGMLPGYESSSNAGFPVASPGYHALSYSDSRHSFLLASSRTPSLQFDHDLIDKYASVKDELGDLDDLKTLSHFMPNQPQGRLDRQYCPDVPEADYLRKELFLPRGAIVNLSAVPENSRGEPAVSLHVAIKAAIYASERKKLTLSEIRKALAKRFRGFLLREEWKGTVRHTLSMHHSLVRGDKAPGRKGSYWSFKLPPSEETRERKRLSRSSKVAKPAFANKSAGRIQRLKAKASAVANKTKVVNHSAPVPLDQHSDGLKRPPKTPRSSVSGSGKERADFNPALLHAPSRTATSEPGSGSTSRKRKGRATRARPAAEA